MEMTIRCTLVAYAFEKSSFIDPETKDGMIVYSSDSCRCFESHPFSKSQDDRQEKKIWKVKENQQTADFKEEMDFSTLKIH